MTKSRILCALALSTMFLDNGRFLQAQPNLADKGRSGPQSSFDKSTKFIRMTRDSEGNPGSLETSITRYRSSDGEVLVDLIGVIHIGEAEYYRKLNYQFRQYESLLYELVAPEGNRVPDRNAKRGGNPIHLLQSSMQKMLGLQSQLKFIDYSKQNFVHADLSPKQMQQKMAERGDNVWSLGIKAFGEMMQKQASSRSAVDGNKIDSFEDLFSIFSDPLRMKVAMASQFAEGGALESGLGATLNQLLIADRNKAALQVLKSELTKGQTQIGLFYGAAHMPDFEKRLVDELGLKRTRQAWVQAWDLRSAPKKACPNGLADLFLEMLDSIE